MFVLAQTVFQIAILQRDPSALPRARGFLLFMLAANVAISALYLSLPRKTPLPPVGLIIAVAIASLAIYVVLLKVYGREERATQVISAILGVDCLFMLIAALLIMLLGMPAATPAMVLLLLWSVVVRGRIVSDGLDWPWIAGVGLEFALVIVIDLVFAGALASNGPTTTQALLAPVGG